MFILNSFILKDNMSIKIHFGQQMFPRNKANIMTLVFWQCICMHLKSHITALNLLSYKYKKNVVVNMYKDCLVCRFFVRL